MQPIEENQGNASIAHAKLISNVRPTRKTKKRCNEVLGLIKSSNEKDLLACPSSDSAISEPKIKRLRKLKNRDISIIKGEQPGISTSEAKDAKPLCIKADNSVQFSASDGIGIDKGAGQEVYLDQTEKEFAIRFGISYKTFDTYKREFCGKQWLVGFEVPQVGYCSNSNELTMFDDIF